MESIDLPENDFILFFLAQDAFYEWRFQSEYLKHLTGLDILKCMDHSTEYGDRVRKYSTEILQTQVKC